MNDNIARFGPIVSVPGLYELTRFTENPALSGRVPLHVRRELSALGSPAVPSHARHSNVLQRLLHGLIRPAHARTRCLTCATSYG